MKTGYIKTVGWILLCSATLLFSCDRDDNLAGAKHYRLTVKAIDPDSENIKDNVVLYFFNSDLKLEQVAQCKLDNEYDISGDYNKKYTVIALGCSADMKLPDIALGTSISDAQIILNESSFVNNIVVNSPGDIFHGRLDVEADCGDFQDVVWIKRKVAALTIITHNLQDALNTTDDDFSYVVRQTYGTLDLEGKFKGNKVAYHPTSSFNSTNKDLVASKFYTYPSQDNDGLSIDIYKGANLIKTYSNDADQNQMLLKEGKHTVVYIDFRKDNNNVDGSMLNVVCKVKDWADSNINEGFN